MTKEEFNRNKTYPNLEEIANRIFERKAQNMTKEELEAYKKRVQMRFIAAAYYNSDKKTLKPINTIKTK